MNKIGIIIGSLRKKSFSKVVGNKIIDIIKNKVETEIIDISNLGYYNQDLDKNPPIEWVNYRKKLNEFDSFIFITPEYNRSFPGLIKNAIDIGTRPYNDNKFSNKSALVVSQSPGEFGGIVANMDLKKVLGFLNMNIMFQPELYINSVNKSFDNGLLIDDELEEYIVEVLNKYLVFIRKD